VTVFDGRPIPAGDLAGLMVSGHDSFQRPQAFIEAVGSRGLQEEVLLSGSWNLNSWFAHVEPVPLVEVPIEIPRRRRELRRARAPGCLGGIIHAPRPGGARTQGRVGRAAAAGSASPP
jgi:uncharacterized membrane protein YqiK